MTARMCILDGDDEESDIDLLGDDAGTALFKWENLYQ